MTNSIQIIAAFTGSLGFALLFYIDHDKVIKAGLGGLVSWGTYLLAGNWIQSDPVKFFLGTVALTFYAEFVAVHEKTPVTIFLVSGTIPLIPGGGLYHTMMYMVTQDWHKFLKSASDTLLLALAIAIGMLFGMAASRVIIPRHK